MVDAGWKAIACSEPREFFALRRSISDPTIFIADDAFGTTEYEPGKARPWVESLGEIIPLLDQKHWLIWTARTTPFKLALRRLRIDYAHRNFPSPADVEVNAAQLTVKEKAYIFFQHCRQASFDDSVKKIVRDYAEVVVKDDKFTPERIRRFVNEQLSDELPKIMAGSFTRDDVLRLVREGIDRATEEMVKSFEMLEEDLQAVLIAMLDAGTASVQHRSLEESCVRLFDRGDLLNSLADLEGHFLHRIPRQESTGAESSGTGDNYEWIHPSWRDVVIDWVAANDRLRESFLSRCGVRGLALALSEGGGADGKRSLPFLRSEEDWNYLHVHLPGIVGACDVASHKLLYDTLLEIAEKAGSDQLKVHIENLRRLIIETLRSSRARWDTDAKAIEVRPLDAYYRLSEAVGEVEPSPRLQATWSSTESLWSKVENADFVQEIDLSPLEDAIWLIKLLAENEPRFLKVVDFSGQYLPVFRKLLGLIGEYDYDGISRNRESYRGEENYIDELAAVVTKILRIAPLLQSECDNARSKLHERKVKLTEEIEQMDEDPTSSVTAQAKIHAVPKVGNTQKFSVSELCATL